MDSQSEIGHFFQKLSIWRDESHKEFSNIITFHSSSISKGINDLVEEVSDLKAELSIITKERNDLLETVHNLSSDIRKRSVELPNPQTLPEPEEMHSNDVPEAISPILEVEEESEQNTEISNMIQSESGELDDITLNESAETDIDEDARDEELTNKKVNEENGKQEESVRANGRKERNTNGFNTE